MASLPEYASEFKFFKLSYARPGVLHLEFNRAPVNAFSEPVWREYGAVFDRISHDSNVRAVVISSALKLFCGGVDLAFLQNTPKAVDPGRAGLLIRQLTREFQHAIGSPERCPYPVIVATHGKVIGLGLDIIAACDIRWASEDAEFSIKEAAVGLAADVGALARLPKVVGNHSMLMELAHTAREFTPAEAKDLGLVSKIVPGGRNELIMAALDLASSIAKLSPIATVGTKRFIQHARDHNTDTTLEYQSTWNMGVQQAPDMAHAAAAAKKKEIREFPSLAPWVKPTTKL